MRCNVMVAAALLAASPAAAKVQTFDFVARIDQPAALVPAGTLINGSFSFDDALSPAMVFKDAGQTTAFYQDPSITLRFRFPGVDFAGNARAGVFDFVAPPITLGDDEADSFDLLANAGDWTYNLTVWQPDRTWLTGSGLPAGFPTALWQGPFPDPNDDDGLTVPHGEFFVWNGKTMQGMAAVLLSVSPGGTSAVPEPGSWALLIAGFGMAGTAVRRARHRLSPA